MPAPVAYYNEIDPKKAAWLRDLINRGLITQGDVDERSIAEVSPRDLEGYTQCHFFAGIGVWSYALWSAGWLDSRPVWTASCPCQPFSVAGKRKAQKDSRHLWPVLFRLIEARGPVILLGEQVASKDGLAWLDDVCVDLEECDYTIGAAVTPACGYGAPHRRERLYFCAVAEPDCRRLGECNQEKWAVSESHKNSTSGESMGQPSHSRLEGRQGLRRNDGPEQPPVERAGGPVRPLELPSRNGRIERRSEPGRGSAAGGCSTDHSRGPVNGFWSDSDWIWCRDQKYRAVEPGTCPLAHGAPQRVGRLRGYGDAIVAPQAVEWIKAVMDTV